MAVGVAAALPATAGAYATPAPPPNYSNSAALPDGRVYEQVSPSSKGGYGVAGTNREALKALARADGNAFLYAATGPIGEASSGLSTSAVSTRTASGWKTRSALPRPLEAPTGGLEQLQAPAPSADFSHMLFGSFGASFVSGDPLRGPNFYLAGEDPLQPPAWIAKPTIANYQQVPTTTTMRYESAGGNQDFSTAYFADDGLLVPEDRPREPYFSSLPDNRGFYEWTQRGGLVSAGVLPGGSVSPFGAIPAGESSLTISNGTLSRRFHNQVSTDGLRAFFVSPSPFRQNRPFCNALNSGSGGCVPELYVRETAADGSRSTVLVSRDDLLPSVGGLPALAPNGPLSVEEIYHEAKPGFYVYASADGSHAFFESVDSLTVEAREAEEHGLPAGFPKQYDFDSRTNTLRYLPGVTDGTGGEASVIAVSRDGSRFAFVRAVLAESKVRPVELDLWSDGPGGGTVTQVSRLPLLPGSQSPQNTYVNQARFSGDASVLVFATTSVLPGGFNNELPGSSGVGVSQIYRYDTAANTLGCVSCPPAGITPREPPNGNVERGEDAILSHMDSFIPNTFNDEVVDSRGISADGSRIFFDTYDPLVTQATNGLRDVYEWDNGTVYLLSSGTSPQNSFFLDNSEDGSDAFFVTSAGLVPSDTDGGYDVYDARAPHPGDNPPPAAVPCQGDVCQGPPSVPSLLAAPASAAFSGLGNPPPQTGPAVKGKARQKPKACRKGLARKRGARKRGKCVKQKRKAKRAAGRSEGGRK